MTLHWQFRLGLAVLGVVSITGCPQPQPGPDTSPPMLNPVIVLGNPPADSTSAGFSIAAADVNRSNIPSNIKIRLIATAAEPDSNITSFTTVSNLTWQCAIRRGSQIIGTVQNAPLAFTPAITTTPNSKSQNF